jgi:hypothetical protein
MNTLDRQINAGLRSLLLGSAHYCWRRAPEADAGGRGSGWACGGGRGGGGALRGARGPACTSAASAGWRAHRFQHHTARSARAPSTAPPPPRERPTMTPVFQPPPPWAGGGTGGGPSGLGSAGGSGGGGGCAAAGLETGYRGCPGMVVV